MDIMRVNPQKLDLKALPWLPLEEKAAFPKKAAIYLAIDSLGTVQYIGRSINVHKRWGNHHKYEELIKLSNVKISYLFFDETELLPEIESALIEWFSPPLNKANGISKNGNKKSKLSIQLENEVLKEACEVYVEDKNLKSMSALINMALIELLTKEKYYKPAQPPKRLK